MKDANRKSEPKRLSQIDGCLADKKTPKKHTSKQWKIEMGQFEDLFPY